MLLVHLSDADIESAVMEWAARAYGYVPERVIIDVTATGGHLPSCEAYIACEIDSGEPSEGSN